MAELKLSRSVEIDGEKKNVIEFDLEELKGDVIENAMKSMGKLGYIPALPELDPVLHAHIFAEAAGIDYLDVKRFAARDYLAAGSAVKSFFFSDSEDSPQENTSGA